MLAPPAYLRAEWDAKARVLDVGYADDAVLDEAMATETTRWLDAFLAQTGADIGILVDGGNIRDASPAYRQQMGRWFRARGRTTRMALYDLSPLVRVMALLFAKATGLRLHIAADREEARRWLTPLPAR